MVEICYGKRFLMLNYEFLPDMYKSRQSHNLDER
nr:MAG TPA: hypothetical protein [Caudoviricetes sp.]